MLVWFILGRHYYRLRIRLSQLDCALEMRYNLKLSKEAFESIVAAFDIKPVYCVNGEDL